MGRPAGADAHDVRAGGDPRIIDHRRRRRGDEDDQIGAAHRRFSGVGGNDRDACRRAHVVDELLAAVRPRRPDPDLLNLPHELIRLEMAARLHAAANNRQCGSIGPAEKPRRHRGDGRGPRFRDVATVHDREQRAGLRIEQQDGREVRGQVLRMVVGKHRDQLGAEACRCRHVGRHQAKVGFARTHHQHRAHRLQHFARRVLGKSGFHGRDQIAHRQQRVHLLLGQEAKMLSHCSFAAVRIVLAWMVMIASRSCA